jgi:LacI family transcriptional regulator
MLRAKLLLTETDLPISEVAKRTGFEETKYFCEVFRKTEGKTATQFRKSFHGNTWNQSH